MNILRNKRRKGKKIKPKRLLLLIFFLIMTTFAWFAYYKILDTDFVGHLKTWNVEFSMNGENKKDVVDLTFNNLYPGMEEQIITINTKNNGEVITKIDYIFQEVKILGNTYQIIEDMSQMTNPYFLLVKKPVISSDGKKTFNLIDDKETFPFSIKIENDDELLPGKEGILKISINWIGDNDELDTTWGYNVSKYLETTNNTLSPIELKIKMNAIQLNE